MEAPPPLLPTAPPTTPAASVYPDSVGSSPRSRHTESWDTEPPPPQKLRLMCSYGGHIVPRPHDKNLCYIGGDTRIIVIDRHTSLSDLRHRLSKTLLSNQSFALKYQLPTEDLDSLISVTTDEDLENMVEEYDRLNNAAGGAKPGRIRLFLFPQSSANIEQLLIETSSTKSDDWFFNALNGKASALSAAASDRGFSESSSVNCLLGLDEESVGKTTAAGKDVEAQIEAPKVRGNGTNQDVHSVPDSPMLETMSSFGSTSSSPSMANLRRIKVHVEENQKVGIEDQFQQMSVGTAKAEEVGGSTAGGVPVMVSADQHHRVISEDEKSDPGGYRRVQQIQQPVQSQTQKQTGGFEMASPESVSSEGSMKNPLRQGVDQEAVLQHQSGSNVVAGDQSVNKIQEYEQNQPQMQQFIQGGNQYIPAGAMPYTPYYSVYPSSQQQQQYYFVPARPTQAYNMPVQQQQQAHTEMGHTQTAYTKPVNVAPSNPEIAGVYRTAAPQMMHTQPQYIGFPPSSYDFNDQLYYTQPIPIPPHFSAHYQIITSAPQPDASSHKLHHQ